MFMRFLWWKIQRKVYLFTIKTVLHFVVQYIPLTRRPWGSCAIACSSYPSHSQIRTPQIPAFWQACHARQKGGFEWFDRTPPNLDLARFVSLIWGIISTLLTLEGWLVKKRSRVFLPLVGLSTTCSRPWSWVTPRRCCLLAIMFMRFLWWKIQRKVYLFTIKTVLHFVVQYIPLTRRPRGSCAIACSSYPPPPKSQPSDRHAITGTWWQKMLWTFLAKISVSHMALI